MSKKELRSRSRAASGIGATFVGKKTKKIVHHGVIGTADQRRCLAFLGDQAGQDKPVEMMRQGRRSDAERLLQVPDRSPGLTCPHQRTIKVEPRRIAERLELFCCLFEFHRNKVAPRQRRVNTISKILINRIPVSNRSRL
jgi:hypothetical protein